MDTEINSCKQRLNTLEHSDQFLSNVHDDHKALKLKLDKSQVVLNGQKLRVKTLTTSC